MLLKFEKMLSFSDIGTHYVYIGCGVTTGIGAVINTGKIIIRLSWRKISSVVFGLRNYERIGLNVIQGLKMVGANQNSWAS